MIIDKGRGGGIWTCINFYPCLAWRHVVHARMIKRQRSIVTTEASLVKRTIKSVLEENLERDSLKRADKRILELTEEGGEVEQLFIEATSTFRSSTTYRSSATKRERLLSALASYPGPLN